jgi:sarcosine oxidase
MATNQSATINTSFDVIVIGVGSMGSAACFFLAQRNYKVLGLEQFDIPHDQGSHGGQSRIIRKAYFEHTDYVPLLNKAYENWKNFEAETGTQIYYRTGLVYFGKPGNAMIKGVKQSASLYNIPLENLSSSVASKRFPQLIIPEDFETLFEPDAGFIQPGKAITLYKDSAIKKGAEIHTKEKVLEWKKDGNRIKVTTDKKTYCSSKLIITAGAWEGKLIPGFADKIKVTRQFVAWIKPKRWNEFELNKFPCWMIADDKKPGAYYGFPILPVDTFGGPEGLKLAYHYPATETNPDTVNRQPAIEDKASLKYFLDKYMPDVFESEMASGICLYASTPDENFIIDMLPGCEGHVIIACGFSGHGFKFVSVIGEILADLATEGETTQPIDFLRLARFSS